MKIYMDSKSAMALAKNLIYHERSKNIDIYFHFIREHVKEKNVDLIYMNIHDKLLTFFTKSLVVDPFHKLKNFLRMKDGRQLSLRRVIGNS